MTAIGGKTRTPNGVKRKAWREGTMALTTPSWWWSHPHWNRHLFSLAKCSNSYEKRLSLMLHVTNGKWARFRGFASFVDHVALRCASISWMAFQIPRAHLQPSHLVYSDMHLRVCLILPIHIPIEKFLKSSKHSSAKVAFATQLGSNFSRNLGILFYQNVCSD